MLNGCLNIVVRFNNDLSTSKDKVVIHLHEAPHFMNVLKVIAEKRTIGVVPYAGIDTRHVYNRAHNSLVVLKGEADLKY